jgi:hypothetical protein
MPYRFKTEQEFIEEFGEVHNFETNWSTGMNHLFGVQVDCVTDLENIPQESVIRELYSKFPNSDNTWNYCPQHFTDKPLPITNKPLPSKNTVTETEVQTDLESFKNNYYKKEISFDISLQELLRKKYDEGFDAALEYIKSRNKDLKL